jgi:hypothetical protein
LVHYVTIADESAEFQGLYSNQEVDPIKLESQVPTNGVEFSKYISIPQGQCLVLQTGNDSNGKPKKQKEIWGTVKLASKLSPTHISSIIGGDLQLLGVGCWRKRVQDRDTRSDFVIVSCHFDVCAEAVKQKLIPKLKLMEKAMFKRGIHTKYKKLPQPEFALISKNIQEPS